MEIEKGNRMIIQNKFLRLITLIFLSNCCFAKSVCIFCSSKDSISETYKPIAFEIGKKLAQNDIGLVTGGRNTGLMNEVINGHASVKDSVPQYAIIPKVLKDKDVLNSNINSHNITWTNDLHDRLSTFYTKCDAVVVLPGAYGAMQEMMDVIENNKFGTIKKPVYILNVDKFWGPTLEQFDVMIQKGAMQKTDLQYFTVVESVVDIIKFLG